MPCCCCICMSSWFCWAICAIWNSSCARDLRPARGGQGETHGAREQRRVGGVICKDAIARGIRQKERAERAVVRRHQRVDGHHGLLPREEGLVRRIDLHPKRSRHTAGWAPEAGQSPRTCPVSHENLRGSRRAERERGSGRPSALGRPPSSSGACSVSRASRGRVRGLDARGRRMEPPACQCGGSGPSARLQEAWPGSPSGANAPPAPSPKRSGTHATRLKDAQHGHRARARVEGGGHCLGLHRCGNHRVHHHLEPNTRLS